MKKTIKIISIILTIVMTCVTVYLISKSYAVFYSEAKGTTTMELARWNIKVNNTEVTKGTEQAFIIQNVIIEANDNVKTGKAAPGTRGSFNIVIDPTDTQVSTRYDISLNKDSLTNSQMKISSISELTGNTTLTRTAESIYTGVIALNQINNGTFTNNIKIIFSWDNDDTNNEADTAIGTVVNPKVNIPITITFSQYMGETITEYEG